jgi:DNA-binding MarR family transcriptional regulator
MAGGMSAGELARAGHLSPAAVTAALDRLERAGYVRRVRDHEDRRRVLVEVTDRMQKLTQEPTVRWPRVETGSSTTTATTS